MRTLAGWWLGSIALLAAALFIGACGGDDDDSASLPNQDPNDSGGGDDDDSSSDLCDDLCTQANISKLRECVTEFYGYEVNVENCRLVCATGFLDRGVLDCLDKQVCALMIACLMKYAPED